MSKEPKKPDLKRIVRRCTVIGDTCIVPLTRGQVTIIDAADHHLVGLHKWHADEINPPRFYACRSNPNGPGVLYLHRILAGVDGLHVDHIDGDTLNNRRSNLRACTVQQNLWNRRPKSRGTSKFKGVSWSASGGRWRVGIRIKGKGVSLGRFDDEVEAARAYDRAAAEHFGEFAWLNFPKEMKAAS